MDIVQAMRFQRPRTRFIDPTIAGTFTMLPDWLMDRDELSLLAKVVYARLVRYYDKERGYAYPSQDRLAAEVRTNDRQVRRALVELENVNLIGSRQRGLGQSNCYYFLDHPWRNDTVDAPPVPPPPPAGEDAPERTERPVRADRVSAQKGRGVRSERTERPVLQLDKLKRQAEETKGREGAGSAGPLTSRPSSEKKTDTDGLHLVKATGRDPKRITAGMIGAANDILGLYATAGRSADLTAQAQEWAANGWGWSSFLTAARERLERPAAAPRPLRTGHAPQRAVPDTTYTDEWAREQNRIQMERLNAAMAARAAGG